MRDGWKSGTIEIVKTGGRERAVIETDKVRELDTRTYLQVRRHGISFMGCTNSGRQESFLPKIWNLLILDIYDSWTKVGLGVPGPSIPELPTISSASYKSEMCRMLTLQGSNSLELLVKGHCFTQIVQYCAALACFVKYLCTLLHHTSRWIISTCGPLGRDRCMILGDSQIVFDACTHSLFKRSFISSFSKIDDRPLSASHLPCAASSAN